MEKLNAKLRHLYTLLGESKTEEDDNEIGIEILAVKSEIERLQEFYWD